KQRPEGEPQMKLKIKSGLQPVYPKGELKTALAELRTTGRIGMTEADHFSILFIPNSPRRWTKHEVLNRLAWLDKQRGKLIASGASLAENDRKVVKYTKELFRRENQKNQAKEQLERNAKRRRKRQMAKRKKTKALVDQWFVERKKFKRKPALSQET